MYHLLSAPVDCDSQTFVTGTIFFLVQHSVQKFLQDEIDAIKKEV
jgi:hypothetical protein